MDTARLKTLECCLTRGQPPRELRQMTVLPASLADLGLLQESKFGMLNPALLNVGNFLLQLLGLLPWPHPFSLRSRAEPTTKTGAGDLHIHISAPVGFSGQAKAAAR